VGLDDVQQAIVTFAATGERCRETAWRDVTREFASKQPTGEIRVIQPGAVSGPHRSQG
jgi:hypothetical protein